MNRDDRLKLYEKLYFYESERREKLSARLSITFAAILATVGLLSFMLNSETQLHWCVAKVLFWLFFAAATVALLIGAWFFRRAWYGHTDEHLPPAEKIEAYHTDLAHLYKDEPNCDALTQQYFDEFLLNCYVKTASVIATNNDGRTHNIYLANLCLTVAVLLSLLASVPFFVR